MIEDVVYQIESDPSEAIAANQKLADSFKQVSNSTDQTAQAFEKFDNASNSAAKTFADIEHVTVSGRDKFISFSQSVTNTGLSMARTNEIFGEFNKSASGIPDHLIGIADGLTRISERSNALTASLGTVIASFGILGPLAIILATAIAAWKIGKALGEMEGLSAEIRNDLIPGLGQAIDVYKKFVDRVGSSISGVRSAREALSEQNEALKQQLWDKYGIAVNTAGLSIEQASAKILAAAHNVNALNMIMADAVRDLASLDKELAVKFAESQMNASDLMLKRQKQIADETLALSKSTSVAQVEQHKKALEELKRQEEQYHEQSVAEAKSAAEKAAAAARQAEERQLEYEREYAKALVDIHAKAYDAMTQGAEDFYKKQADLIKQNNKALLDLITVVDQATKHQSALGAAFEQDATYSLDLLKAVQANGDGLKAYNPLLQDEYDKLIQLYQASLVLTDEQLKLKLAQYEAAKAAEEHAEKLQHLLDIANAGATIFGRLGQIIGGTFGGVLNSVSDGFNAFGYAIQQGADTATAAIYGIGAAVSSLGQVIGGSTGRIVSEIGSIAMAFAEFGPIGAAIAAVTVAVSELFRALQKNWSDAVRSSLANAFGLLGISDDLIKKIADDAKKLNDQELAIVLHMKDLIDETGIGANNIQQYLSMARNVFDYLNRGLLTTAQATSILNDTFAQLAAAAEQFGGAYMTQLKELISLSHQFGLNVQAIADYTKAAFADATTALSAMVDAFSVQVDRFAAKMKGVTPGDAIGIPAHLASGFENLASMFLQQFNAMEAAGMSFNEIMQQLGPTFEKLETMAKQLGLTGSQAFQDLSGIWDALKDDKGALSHVQNLLQWITAMDKVTGITAQEFNKLQHVTSNTFDKLTADIQKHLHNHQKASDAALRQMLPQLMEIIKLHDEYGYKIDKNTQKLIDQAKAEGLIKPDPMQQMIDVLTHMDQTLTQLAQTFGAATTSANNFAFALNNIPNNVDVNLNETTTSNNGGGQLWGGGPLWYDTLSEPKTFTRKQVIGVDPGETLLPKSSSTSQPIIIHNHFYVDSKEVAHTVSEQFANGSYVISPTAVGFRR